jgi:hypothetical protein
MSGSIRARRTVGLLVLLVAAIVALSGPVAEAKKEKKKKFNTVQCANVGFDCRGTDRRDRLVGTDSDDSLISLGSGDVLKGNGGDDTLQGGTGDDTYTGYKGDFGSDLIFDSGSGSDVLDLSSFRSEDFSIVSVVGDTDLFLFGPGDNEIEIDGQFGTRRIEKIKFADKTLKASQLEGLAREATPEVQAALEEERPNDDERPSQDERSPQEEKE